MPREQTYLQVFGKKLISFKQLDSGEILGTGVLNPILNKLNFFTMLIIQAKFYSGYKKLALWHGKRVANTFAPPLGSSPMKRLIKNAILGRLSHQRRPLAMTFAVTYKCQCHCIHCSAGKFFREKVRELSTKEAKRIIDESTRLGVSIIAFTGGEPLLRPDIFELIADVDKTKAVTLLFTNGEFLTEENVKKLKDAGLYSAFVSIDNVIPHEHDTLRGNPGLFKKAIDGIARLRTSGILTGLSSYATRSATTHGEYKKIYALARQINAQNVMLFDGVPTGNMLKDTTEMLLPEQREEIRQFSSILFQKGIIPPLSSQSWQNSIEGYLGGIGCLAANIQYYVSAYGDVTPCDFTPLSFGNIRQQSLYKIWTKMVNHPAYKHRSTCCRMQHPKFRCVYIDPIPENVTLPYPIEKLSAIDYRKV